jgi:hypothetical protein
LPRRAPFGVLPATGLAVTLLFGCAEPSPPQDTTASVIAGLWALASQPNPVSLDDLARHLRMDLSHYADAPAGGWEHSLKAAESRNDDPVQTVELSGVSPSSTLDVTKPGELPARQEIRFGLNVRNCVSIGLIASQTGSQTETGWIPNAHGPTLTFNYVQAVQGATTSTLTANPACSTYAEIRKNFGRDYWGKGCPFRYDQTVEKQIVLPELRRHYRDAVPPLDLARPGATETKDRITLVFHRVRAEPARPETDPFMYFSIDLERCSLRVLGTSGYPRQ